MPSLPGLIPARKVCPTHVFTTSTYQVPWCTGTTIGWGETINIMLCMLPFYHTSRSRADLQTSLLHVMGDERITLSLLVGSWQEGKY